MTRQLAIIALTSLVSMTALAGTPRCWATVNEVPESWKWRLSLDHDLKVPLPPELEEDPDQVIGPHGAAAWAGEEMKVSVSPGLWSRSSFDEESADLVCRTNIGSRRTMVFRYQDATGVALVAWIKTSFSYQPVVDVWVADPAMEQRAWDLLGNIEVTGRNTRFD